MGQIHWLAVFIDKVLSETSTLICLPVVYGCSHTAVADWVVAMQTVGSSKPKILTIWPFIEIPTFGPHDYGVKKAKLSFLPQFVFIELVLEIQVPWLTMCHILFWKTQHCTTPWRKVWSPSTQKLSLANLGLEKSESVSPQSCPALCDPMGCSSPGSSVHGMLRARILEWVTIPFSRGSSRPRDRARVSCIAGRFFIIWATAKPLELARPSLSLTWQTFAENLWNYHEQNQLQPARRWPRTPTESLSFLFPLYDVAFLFMIQLTMMDREAWRAAIHGVTKSRTRLSDWTELNWTGKLYNSHFSSLCSRILRIWHTIHSFTHSLHK